MHQRIQTNEEWITALKAGCRLVNRACLPGGGEDDLRRGRVTAMALLMGASNSWLQEQLMLDREDRIKKFVQQRLH